MPTPRRRRSRATSRSPLTPVRVASRRPRAASRGARVRGRLDALPTPARVLVDWGGTLLAAVAIVLLLRACVAAPYRVSSAVMEPTLHCASGAAASRSGCGGTTADRVLVNRFVYRLRDPGRGDIVAVEVSARAARQCGIDEGEIVFHRIVGLPGESVTLRRGAVTVDGKRLREPYLAPRRRGTASGTWRVPRGRYFLLGDNRIVSCDSRVWGAVSTSALRGPVLGRYWPLGRIGQAAAFPGLMQALVR